MARIKKVVTVVEVPAEVVVDEVAPAEVTTAEVPKEVKPRGDVVLDVPLEKTVSVLGFGIRVMTIDLFKSCRLAITIKCSCLGREYTDYKELVLEGDDYTKWASDDNYIVQLVTSKLPELL